MPANPELEFLSLAAELGNLRPAIRAGVEPETLGGMEARDVYTWMLKYFRAADTRNLVPTHDQISDRFPRLELPDPPVRRHTLQSLCRVLKDRWLIRSAEAENMEYLEKLRDNPREAIDNHMQSMRKIRAADSDGRDVYLAKGAGGTVARYDEAKNSTALPGIPYPRGWGRHTDDGRILVRKSTGRQDHPLNEESRGIGVGELIILYGRPKSLKTWCIIDMAAEAYIRHRCRVLFYTKEMTPDQVQDRVVARLAEVSYGELRRGTLASTDEHVLRSMVHMLAPEEKRHTLRGHPADFLITEGWGKIGSSDIDALYTKAEEFQPDIIFADAAYLMQEHAGSKSRSIWEGVTNVSRALKTAAVNLKVPVVATTQANRTGEETKGSTVAEIAYADAFGQDCTLAIRIIKQEKRGDEDGVFLNLIIPVAREITLAGLRLDVIPASRFLLDQTYTSQNKIQALLSHEAKKMATEQANLETDLQRRDDRVNRQMESRKRRMQL